MEAEAAGKAASSKKKKKKKKRKKKKKKLHFLPLTNPQSEQQICTVTLRMYLSH